MLFVLWGCSKEPVSPLFEIPINGTQKTIKVEQNGIGVTFSLLNAQGQPATVFNESENFKFYLAITNNVEKDTAMYIVSDFLGNPELFRVYNENGSIIGKPWILSSCLYISDQVNKILSGGKWIIESPWNEKKTFNTIYDSTAIRYLQCYFKGLDQPMLPAGKYYTLLTQQFCLGRFHNALSDTSGIVPEEYVCTDTLKLKINFEIK